MVLKVGAGKRRFSANHRRSLAASVAYVLALSSLVLTTLPMSPAVAAPGDVSDLVVAKTSSSGSVVVGDSVEFTVTVTNTGPAAATSIVLSDVLPPELAYESSQATRGSYDPGSGLWSVGDLAVGTTAVLSVSTEATSEGLANNTAAVSSVIETDPDASNDTSTASVTVVSVPPATCSTTQIIGVDDDTIYSIDTTTGAASPIFTTTQSTGGLLRNALASNSDQGFIYWGSGTTVYWYNATDGTEGVLADFSGQINGTLESAGASYLGHYYYFTTEAGDGSSIDIYRVGIDPNNGALIAAGTLEQLEANQPDVGLEAALGRNVEPAYGDITAVYVAGDVVLFGSTVDLSASGYPGHWWSYNVDTGVVAFISNELAPTYLQLGTDLTGQTWGGEVSGDLYRVDITGGTYTNTGFNFGFSPSDFAGSYCQGVPQPNLDLTKALIANNDADGSGTISVGDTVTYQFRVTNSGNVQVSNVAISDPLPGLGTLSCTPSTPAVLNTGQVLTCTAPYTITAADQGRGFVTNTATASGVDPGGASVSDTATLITNVAQPGISITKTSDVTDPVEPGQTITYTLDIANTGPTTVTGIGVSDLVASGTTFVPGSASVTAASGGFYLDEFNAVSYGNSDGSVAWNTSWSDIGEGNDPAGGDVQILNDVSNYQLRLRDADRGIERSADLAGATSATVSLDFRRDSLDSGSEYVTLQVAASPAGPWRQLAIFSGPATDGSYASTGGLALQPAELTSTTTFRLTTSGALSNYDRFWVDNFRVDFSSVATAAGHDAVDLVVPADGYMLPPGGTMQVTFEAVADAILTVTSIDNTANAYADGGLTARGSVSDPVAQADLAVTKTVDNPAPNPGDALNYKITVTNNGPAAADLVEVADVLPTGVTYSADDSGGAYDTGTGVWTVGPLANGESAVLIVAVVVDVGTAGTEITNSASVAQSDRPDPDPTDNTASAESDVPLVDLGVVKTVDDPGPVVGDTVTFSVVVTNGGPDPASGIVLADQLPTGLTYVSGTATQGSYDEPSGAWDVGSLAAGADATLTLTATVNAGTFGSTITNRAAVATIDETDSDSGNDADSATVSVQRNPEIEVVKAGPSVVTVGENVDYAFSLSHTAASDNSPVTVEAVVDDVAGTATYVSGDTNGNARLDGGETWIFSASHVVGGSDPDPLVNIVTVAATDGDGDSLPAATDSHRADIEYLPVLDLVKTGPAYALVGDSATYTFEVSHGAASDGTPVSGVTVTDDVAGAASYMSGDDGDGLLEAGETWVFSAAYTFTAGDADPLVNTGTAAGSDLDGATVTASDTHSTDLIAPAIAIEKTPDLQTILSGDDASFTITVTNTGDADLSNVAVTDALVSACDATVGDLAAGTSSSYSCTVPAVTADFTNTASVTADHPAGGSVSASDSAVVDVIGPAISIAKSPGSQTILSGEDASFTISVVNTGDVTLTDVMVSDVLAPSCGRAVGDLAAGDSASYVCSLSGVTADFMNTATVSAGHAAGGTVTDSDTADVDVIAPAIDIAKTPDVQTILPGDDATFTITVTNTGDVDLSNVVVSDALAPGCEATLGSLAAGAVQTYSCTVVGVAADFSNTARVSGDHPAGGSVTDTDTAAVDVIHPAIVIAKTPDSQVIVTGDDAVFTIGVSNTGDVALSNVAVTDASAPDCDATIGSLGAGASTSYTCTAPGATTDFTNTAIVSADHAAGGSVTDSDSAVVDVIAPAIDIQKTPDTQALLSGGDATFTITVTNTGDADLADILVTDALAPACDATFASLAAGAVETYSCTATGVTADFTNRAIVSAGHAAGGTVTDSDTAAVDVIAPSVDIEKTPDTQTIVAGDDATFTITVTNTGDVDLSDAAVADALAPACDAYFVSLAVGAVETYSCTVAGATADFTNSAAVTAAHAAGGIVGDSDTAAVDVISPAIDIQKTPDQQTIVTGSDATFTIKVTNTGDVGLSNVTVSDASVPACDATFGALAVGAVETYSCTVTGVGADFTNTAEVTAAHPAGGSVSDSDSAAVDVVAPAIDIEKTPDTQIILAGDDATFTITVTNTGDVELTNAAVTDALAPACDATIGALAVGASTSYSCTAPAVTGDFTNSASVVARHPAGGTVGDTDTAAVDVIAPSVDIEKTPDTQTVVVGGDAIFTITVANTGDVDLSDVAVTDALASACDAAIGGLAAGASTSYSCTAPDVAADFTNTAEVTAAHPAGGSVSDSDTAAVDVIAPAVSIEKTPDTQTILAGANAAFTITVANAGDADLTNVVVNDPLAPDCGASFATLAVGAVESYGCTLPAVTADLTNVADVVARVPTGGTVSDSDTAVVDIIAPAISIAKTPDSQIILPGSDASFTITVTNTGDADLSGVAVGDALVPACDATIGDLAAGATASYTCTATGVAAGFTNTAEASGDHAAGGTVTDTDTAAVDVISPAIDIEKTPNLQTILAGGDATFTITVTNTGDAGLGNVTVTDALAPDCDATLGDLAVGAATSYDCTLAAVAADFTNTAAVSADHPAGGTVGDTDTAVVDVIAPAIDIQKTPDIQQILAGADATFTISVTNTGDVDLSNVTVTDAPAPDCDAAVGDLAVGATTSYSCELPTVGADTTNTAAVTADHPAGGSVGDSDTADVDVVAPAISIAKTPDLQDVLGGGTATFTITVTNTGDVDLSNVAVADPLAPACAAAIGDLAVGASSAYNCDLAGVTADFTNTAVVRGDHPAGGSVTDRDTADVIVISPAIDIVKDPPVQQLLAGQDAGFTITVTNTGDAPLADVTVTDPLAPGCDTVISALGVGASATVTCSVPGVTTGFANTASVVATHGAGGTVADTATADVVVLVPAVDIQKTPDLQLVTLGGMATFTITVTNAGVVPLSNVAVRDPLSPDCDATIGALAAGEATTYPCTIAGLAADFTNTATVSATDAVGNPAGDSDTADVDVVAPAISISKSPDGQAVVLGGTATFTIEVTNTGDVDLSNVTVTDAAAPACDAVVGGLVVGASAAYSCDRAGVGADFTNSAVVTADHPAGGTVSSSDTADVTVLVPGISIDKTPDTQLVGVGGTASFTITVTNTGATPLDNVAVTDGLVPACDAVIGALAVGASASHGCDAIGVAADFTNTAEVTADDPLGNPVASSDTADVDLVVPAIVIEKTPDLQTLLAGEDANFTITVTNTGDTSLSNVEVTDPLAPACDATFAALAAGETQTTTCTANAIAADFTNVASVSADTPLGGTVGASDDAFVDVVAPGVEIEKTPDTQQIRTGDDAAFTITVTNTGDVDLTGVAVTDPLVPSCDAMIAALAVGESTSYSCTALAIAADFTNIASVAGTDAIGNRVSDSDDAAVDVIDPAVEIAKTPDAQTVVSGGDATFTITVINTGDVDLTGVAVTDPQTPACDTVIGDLVAGGSTSYTCSRPGVIGDFTNTAAVTGTDPIGRDVADSDTADVAVLVPGIDIQKTPDLQQIATGGTATFTITVTNAGATPLHNVAVADALAPTCNTVVGDMEVGDSTFYSCTVPGVAADFTNTAGVTGADPLGNQVSDSDTADVDVISPAITISKSPDGQTVVMGGTATFTIEVTNTGDVDLAGVTVSDPLVPACDNTIGNLASNDSVSYTCSASTLTSSFTNTAAAAGTDPIGATVGDSDTADVTVVVPGIDLQKTPDIQTVVAGDIATFTIIVTNTGDTDLNNVAVADPLAPDCDATVGTLPVGAAPFTYTCAAVAAASFTNTASVLATDPLGVPLGDSDTADVVAMPRGGISGTIAHDVAGDGIIGGGDPGLVGVDVTATWAGLDGVFGTADDEVLTTTTDARGGYTFEDAAPGAYEVVIDTADLPPGVDLATVDPDTVLDGRTLLTVPPATTVADVDFAYTGNGSIGDTVFFDIDGNGAQGPGEPGLGGIDVGVTWFGGDGVFGTADDLVFTTTTSADGTYIVDGLPAGDFTVVVDAATVPAGLSGDLDQGVTLDPAESREDVDFALAGSGSIGDQVFDDVDRDGGYDAGEPGIDGVAVDVIWAGFDSVFGTADDMAFTTGTDFAGHYRFDHLPAGDYRVALDDATIPSDLGAASPVALSLAPGASDMTADFPLVGNRPPVAGDDSATTGAETPVTIPVVGNDSDPDGHSLTVSTATDPANGTVTVNPDGTITYTPAPGFAGTDTFVYTICEVDGVSPSGIPATGLCDSATVTVVVNDVNQPPGPNASFQTVVVGYPAKPIPVSDPEGGPVTVTYVSGELPPGLTLNPDGSFSGVATDVGTYRVVVEVCDDEAPQLCIEHTHTIAVTPASVPGPDTDPGDQPPATLPFTGGNFGELLWASLLMMLVGAALVLFSQKRRVG